MSEPNQNKAQFLGIETRNIKLGLYGFCAVFVASALTLKPYLTTAIYHNFARIDDYRFFKNRVVRAATPGRPLETSPSTLPSPPEKTEALLKNLSTTALLVLQDGKIAYERYSEGGGIDEISGSFSMAKSIVSLLTGFAL